MTDKINNSTQNQTYKYALTASAVGLAGGAAIGAITPVIRKDYFTEEFVKTVHKNILNSPEGKFVTDMIKVEETPVGYAKQLIRTANKHTDLFDKFSLSQTDNLSLILKHFGCDEPLESIMLKYKHINAKKDNTGIKVGKDFKELICDIRSTLYLNTDECLTTGSKTNFKQLYVDYLLQSLNQVFDTKNKKIKTDNFEPYITAHAKRAITEIRTSAAAKIGIASAIIAGCTAGIASSMGLFDKLKSSSNQVSQPSADSTKK